MCAGKPVVVRTKDIRQSGLGSRLPLTWGTTPIFPAFSKRQLWNQGGNSTHQDGPSQKLDGSFPAMLGAAGTKETDPRVSRLLWWTFVYRVLAVVCHTWATEQVSELPESSPTVLLVS